jgi:hypothetical protein
MSLRKPLQTGLVAISLFVSCLCTSALAEERNTRAIMQWEGEGAVYNIGPSEIIFLGAFEGIMYFEGKNGALDGAFVTCPSSQRLNLEQATTSAKGFCEITVSSDDVAYAEWTCEGIPGDCKGKFNLVSGHGRYEGISGSSDFRIRSIMGELVSGMGNGSVMKVGKGIALLPNLVVNLVE